jgi:hypothetical protein
VHAGSIPAVASNLRAYSTSVGKPAFVSRRLPAEALAKAGCIDSGRSGGLQLRQMRAFGAHGSELSRLCKAVGLCYEAPCRSTGLFPGSSVVEQPAVNRLVAGSNPARGAKPDQSLISFDCDGLHT